LLAEQKLWLLVEKREKLRLSTQTKYMFKGGKTGLAHNGLSDMAQLLMSLIVKIMISIPDVNCQCLRHTLRA